MNLHNLSEQEFDKKLREHLAKSSVPYNPASWDKLSRRLDSIFGANGNNRSIIGLSLLLLVLAGVFFFGVSSFSQSGLHTDTDIATSIETIDNSSSEAETASPNVSNNRSSEAKIGTPNEVSSNSLSEIKTSPLRETNNSNSSEASGHDLSGVNANSKLEVSTSTSLENKQGGSSNVAPPAKVDRELPRANEEPDLSGKNEQTSTTATKSTSPFGAQQLSSADGNSFRTEEYSSDTDTPAGSNDQVGLTVQSQKTMRQLSYPETVAANGIKETDFQKDLPDEIQGLDAINASFSPVTEVAMTSPWLIGFGYAPDISLVGFGEATSPGTNLGISLEYKLNSRWSVQTGLIYSMKRYKAEGEDYHPPEDFWGYSDTPDGADGECNVIDIPINLRYYFKPAARHQFFAGTGISSYLMLTEDYYYHYDDYGYNQVDQWSVSNENRHYFSIYNISAGYQRNLSKQWYLEIEPFLKVPLSGIGFGEVDLWSTGAMFSIKYNVK